MAPGDRENQQHSHAQGGEEHEDGGAVSRRERTGLLKSEAAALVGCRVGGGEAPGENAEFGCGLRARDARAEASDDGEPVKVARLAITAGDAGRQLIKISERDPKLGVEGDIDAAKLRRSDAHDGEGPAGKGDGFAENGGVRGETALPEAVAEDNNGETVLVAGKTAAKRHA